MKSKKKINELNLEPGFLLTKRFEVKQQLGAGWEGEVYSIVETSTGIERAAKVFYPDRNIKNKASNFYAKKLHKLRNCSILIQYLFQGQLRYKGHEMTYLISDYVEGEALDQFIHRQKGKRLHPFQAIHLLYVLTVGLEEIHLQKEYHGDLHTGNIIVQRMGLNFEVKLIDFFHMGAGSTANRNYDICDLIRVFYDSLGGKATYSKQPKAIKEICCGLKNSQILKKFRTASELRHHLETMSWD